MYLNTLISVADSCVCAGFCIKSSSEKGTSSSLKPLGGSRKKRSIKIVPRHHVDTDASCKAKKPPPFNTAFTSSNSIANELWSFRSIIALITSTRHSLTCSVSSIIKSAAYEHFYGVIFAHFVSKKYCNFRIVTEIIKEKQNQTYLP